MQILISRSFALTLICLLFITPEVLRYVPLTLSMNLFATASVPWIRYNSRSLSHATANYLRTHTQTKFLRVLTTRLDNSENLAQQTKGSLDTRFYSAGQPMVTWPTVVQLHYTPAIHTVYCANCAIHINMHHSPTSLLRHKIGGPQAATGWYSPYRPDS